MFGEGITGGKRENGMDGGDGKRSWMSHRKGQKGASPHKEKPQIGRRDVQGDTEITVGRDGVVPMGKVGFLGGRDGEIRVEDLVREGGVEEARWV